MVGLKTILIPTDGSLRSEKACEFAVKNFSGKGFIIEVYHVMKPGGNINEAETFVKKAKEKIARGDFKEVKTKIVEALSDIGKEILNEARNINAYLIVLSRYGADRTYTLGIGGVVNEIVKNPEFNVIIVK